MFQATLCSSSGGQIVLIQHVTELSVSDRPVCRCAHLHTGRSPTENTITDAVLIQFDLLMMSTVLLETCRVLK